MVNERIRVDGMVGESRMTGAAREMTGAAREMSRALQEYHAERHINNPSVIWAPAAANSSRLWCTPVR